MGKAVLISIQPKWCGLIAAGKKTLEIRKSRPKQETPFKVYIYCTLSGSNEFFKDALNGDVAAWNRGKWGERKGNVIGEFICDAILTMSIEYSDPNSRVALKEFPGTCLTDKQIIDYMGNGVTGYGWHICGLKIYEKPKQVSEFYFPPETFCEKELCGRCPKEQSISEYGDVMFDCEWKRPVMRAPQSWCYVEEV